ncbi:phage tail tape measure protein, partial [Proteus faecis]
QKQKVSDLEKNIRGYKQILASPGPKMGDFMINHLSSESEVVKQLEDAEASLLAEQEKLLQMQEKSTGIQSALKNIE